MELNYPSNLKARKMCKMRAKLAANLRKFGRGSPQARLAVIARICVLRRRCLILRSQASVGAPRRSDTHPALPPIHCAFSCKPIATAL